MIKETLFPKIKRMEINKKYQITEKLDGSNLGIANIYHELYIVQRNIILDQYNLYNEQNVLYKGLYNYIKEYKTKLLDTIKNGTVIFGEWLGMGHIKYENMKQFNLFAKAEIESQYNFYDGITSFNIEKLNFDIEKLKYAFIDEKIPEFLGMVPIVENNLNLINKETIDKLYDEYSKKQNRLIEGFIIYDNYEKNIVKYVRCKNGKLLEHFQW